MVNVLSWNARGIGRKEKRGRFKKFLLENKVDFLMLQETKKSGIDEGVIRSFWGSRNMEFSEVDADGLSGGLLCVWDPTIFSVKEVCAGRNFQILSGNLSSVVLHPQRNDSLIWEVAVSRSYSVKSMYKCIEARMGNVRRELMLLWKNFAPPKAQFLGWLAVLERVKTADLLFSLGVLPVFNDCLCKFCGEAPESVNHLFLHCEVVWEVWCIALRWWGIKWVVPSSIKSLFIWWQSWRFKKTKKVLWEPISFATLWSIWKVRNDLIFRGVIPKWEEMGDTIKFRVATWFKAFQGSRVFSTNDILLETSSINSVLGVGSVGVL